MFGSFSVLVACKFTAHTHMHTHVHTYNYRNLMCVGMCVLCLFDWRMRRNSLVFFALLIVSGVVILNTLQFGAGQGSFEVSLAGCVINIRKGVHMYVCVCRYGCPYIHKYVNIHLIMGYSKVVFM